MSQWTREVTSRRSLRSFKIKSLYFRIMIKQQLLASQMKNSQKLISLKLSESTNRNQLKNRNSNRSARTKRRAQTRKITISVVRINNVETYSPASWISSRQTKDSGTVSSSSTNSISSSTGTMLAIKVQSISRLLSNPSKDLSGDLKWCVPIASERPLI